MRQVKVGDKIECTFDAGYAFDRVGAVLRVTSVSTVDVFRYGQVRLGLDGLSNGYVWMEKSDRGDSSHIPGFKILNRKWWKE